MDIVILSLIRHDAPISSTTLALAKVFSREHRVFYIDHPRTMKDVLAEEGLRGFLRHMADKRQGKLESLEVKVGTHQFTALRPWMTWPVNFFPPGLLYARFSSWNDRRMNKFMRCLIDRYTLKDYLFINAMDPFFLKKFPERIRPAHHVYYSLDNISEVSYTARHGSRLEAEQVGQVEVALATSTELRNKLLQWREEVHLLPNAVDFEHFHKATAEEQEVAEDIRDLDGTLIGYVGSLEYRVDADIMEAVLQAHPDKKLVAIGPVLKEHLPFERLEKYENFVFLGPRKFEELPAYLKAFSCGIIPFRKTGVTRSIYPLKGNEYLAAGLPVVATPFSPDIMAFGGDIELAEGGEAFAGAIEKALDRKKNEDPKKRFDVAKENTWERRVERLWQILKMN